VPVDSVAFTSIASGQLSACGLTAAGTAYCWGDGAEGQLGNGSLADSSTPESVAMPTGVTFVQVTAGVAHACGLTADRTAYCWGDNFYGQLGLGNNTDQTTPQAVVTSGGVSFVQLTAGALHTCGLTAAGDAYCWGANAFGQLGIGNTTSQSTPQAVQMPVGASFTGLTAGSVTTCGLSSSGSAYCWGQNSQGQLGDGTLTNTNTAVAVALPIGIRLSHLVSGGNHSCGITSSRELLCWGYNLYGQVGNGNTANQTSPQLVPESNLIRFTSLSLSLRSTCALSEAGSSYCWGANADGQLGIGTTTDSSNPQRVLLDSPLSSLAIGSTTFSVYGLPVRPASGEQVPTAPLQQFARAESDTCEKQPEGLTDFPALGERVEDLAWGPSWAQWPNGGTGGFVCTRQPYYTSLNTWAVR